MGVDTAIEWADATANFWEGCTQISPGCDHCYAMHRAERYGTVEWNGPPRKVRVGVQVVAHMQRYAISTGSRPFVFVNSLSDFFDNQAPDEWRAEAFGAMKLAPDCVFLILTKRIGNVVRMVEELGAWPSHFWLGASVVNQEEADRDVPKLLAAKSALRIPRVFLSVEPMLGAISFRSLPPFRGALEYWRYDALVGEHWMQDERGETLRGYGRGAVDWVICGGESGKDARPMHPDWARALRDQCAAAGVPFMFKQWGEWAPPYDVAPDQRSIMLIQRGLQYGPYPTGRYLPPGSPSGEMARVGKHDAGRLLDGVEHNGRPQP